FRRRPPPPPPSARSSSRPSASATASPSRSSTTASSAWATRWTASACLPSARTRWTSSSTAGARPSGSDLLTAESPHLRGLLPEELRARWRDLRWEERAARRIQARLVADDGDDLAGVRGLSPAVAREVLRRGDTSRLEVVERVASRVDPFVKYL